MPLRLLKPMLSSIIVDGTEDVESSKEIILFIPFQMLFKSLIWFWIQDQKYVYLLLFNSVVNIFL